MIPSVHAFVGELVRKVNFGGGDSFYLKLVGTQGEFRRGDSFYLKLVRAQGGFQTGRLI